MGYISCHLFAKDVVYLVEELERGNIKLRTKDPQTD
jgi:hypothetical protein